MNKTILKTSKFHIESIIFWPFIFLFWEPFSGKRSHWWNWSKFNRKLDKGVVVKGIKRYHPTNNLWHCLIELNFRWKDLVILDPKDYKGEYQIVYEGNDKYEICSVILKGKTACLVSPKDSIFYAITYPEGKEIQLEISGYAKKNKLDRDILFI